MAIKANKTYFIKRYSSSAYLNVYGNSYTGDMQPIKLWTKVESDPMQKWQFDAEPTTGAYLCTMCDLTRAINLYSTKTPNCTLWAKAGNATDGLVKIQEYASGVYYIYLPNRNLYLTANNTSNGTQVTWTSKVSPASVTQLWQFEEEESLKVDSYVPSSIVNKTCFIKNKATGKYLNVNGYDTVANSTNVNIYDEEDCLAQRWVAKDTENGPKIFTKIDEDYALNIYNGNCTMYEAEGNDRDSLVIFTTQNAAEKTFRIKMYHHDKYLRAEGTVSGSNVGWSNTNDDYALWQFVDEDDVPPSVDPNPEPSPSINYEHGAVIHPDSNKIYPIMLYENGQYYIEPEYERIDGIKEYENTFSLCKFVTGLEFDDSQASTSHPLGLAASIFVGGILAFNESIGSTYILFDFYEAPSTGAKKAIVRCGDKQYTDFFNNHDYNPISLKKFAYADNGFVVTMDEVLWENDVNAHAKELYEKATNTIASDDYKYDIEFTFDPARKGTDYMSQIFLDDEGNMYEYTDMYPLDKVEVIQYNGLSETRIDVTDSISVVSKLPDEKRNLFTIQTVS